MTKRQLAVILGIMALIILASCRSGDLFGKKIDGTEQNPETKTDSQAEIDDREAEAANNVEATKKEETPIPETPEAANVTEVPTYDLKNTCTGDKLGVVRVFDADGKKKVFRPFCDGSSVVTFSCIDGIARPSSKNCPNSCWISPTKGVGECNPNVPPPRKPGTLPKY